MASINEHVAEKKDDSKGSKQTGVEDQQLCLVHEESSNKNAQNDKTISVASTTRRAPPVWPLVGLAQVQESAPNTQTTQENMQSAQPQPRKRSGPLNIAENTNPPELPPRRRMTDNQITNNENPPALPPRNTAPSTYKTEAAMSAGFVNSRKGGFSGNPTLWENERKMVSRTGRVACVPLPVQGKGALSLLQFVEKYSRSLPAEVWVEKGHYGSNDPETLGNNERLIISFVKSKKVLTIITSTRQKFNLPLGSAVQLSLLYNLSGNEEEARKGYTFQTVGDLVGQSPHLPKIVCATQAYRGNGLRSTVYPNELLLVKNFNTQTEKLHVISLGQEAISKFLPLQCNGCFTTKPSKLRMFVSDINVHIGTTVSVLQLSAELELSQLKAMSVDTSIDKSLDGIVKISGFTTERSLIVTRVAEDGAPSTASKKVFEIPVNENLSDVEVVVMQKNMPAQHAPDLASLEVELESLYKEDDRSVSAKTQKLLDDFVRHGHERDGLVFNAHCNVYDEVSDRPPSPVPKVIPYATQDLLKREIEMSSKSDQEMEEVDWDTPATQDSQQPARRPSDMRPSESEDQYSESEASSVSVPKSELEMTIRSVLSDFISDKQKDRGSHYYYTSMDSTEDKDSASRVKLSDVMMELSEIENLWYIFGIRLGVSKTKLDQIHANYGSGPCPNGRCFIETISQWQDNHDNVNWSSIVRALYSMEKKQLAKRVADKHKVMRPDPSMFASDQNNFSTHFEEFIPKERLSEITSRQQQMQEKDQRLHEVQERLGEYEQKIEEYRGNLTSIKDHLQFNERYTRMLTRENQILRMKQAHKEKHFRSPQRQLQGSSEEGQKSQDTLKREIHTLHETQEVYESRIQGAHHDTMELQKQLFSIEGQMKDIKKHLQRLQDQKYQLTRGLHEQECELSSIITGCINEDSNDENEELPQYYNIVRCDGRVEVKLHEEELKMLQQELDRKTTEVGSLKKELKTKHDRMTQIGSLIAQQECDEMAYSYTDVSEFNVLEKHQNDHLKTRLQMEKIDCQIQLTRAWLQKSDIELKLDIVKHCLEMSESVCQRAEELYQKSVGGSKTGSLKSTKSKLSHRTPSMSSTASEESDVFSSRSSSVSQVVSPLQSNTSNQSEQLQTNLEPAPLQQEDTSTINATETQQLTPVPAKKTSASKAPTSASVEETDVQSKIEDSLRIYENTTPAKGKRKSARPRSNALPTGAQRSNQKTTRTSSSSSGGKQNYRNPSTIRSQTLRTTRTAMPNESAKK